MALGTEIKTSIIMTIATVIVVILTLIGAMGMPWYLTDVNEIANQPIQQQLVTDCFTRAKEYAEKENQAQTPEDKQYYQQLKESFLAQCNLEKQQAQ